MKFSFDERRKVNTDLGVVCFLNPYLEKRSENINLGNIRTTCKQNNSTLMFLFEPLFSQLSRGLGLQKFQTEITYL